MWLNAMIVPLSKETSSGSAPASSSVCQGRSNSACSTPSVARTATFIPSSSPAMKPPLPGPPTGHTPAHYGFPVPVSLVPARTVTRVLAGRCVAGPGVVDAVRVAAELIPGGFRVALEHEPAPAEEAGSAFGELIDRVGAAEIASACELTLPVSRLGAGTARKLAGAAAELGLAVALAGPRAPVEAALVGSPDAVVVVPAGRLDAESLCRARAGGRRAGESLRRPRRGGGGARARGRGRPRRPGLRPLPQCPHGREGAARH